ncbi:peptidoglycan DD-metalloendopeptidase family protein [Bacteroidota bacterium]
MNNRNGVLKYKLILIGLLVVSAAGCSDEIVDEKYYPSNAHDAYKHSLEQANLHKTAIGSDWIDASKNVLVNPVEMILPFQEAFYIDSTSAFASAYFFDVLHGQKVDIKVEINGRRAVRLFIDLFRVTEDTTRPFIHVASADENENRLEFETRRNARYIVRLQPELLRGGRCNIVIRRTPSVDFPVSGRDESSIQSFFGDPRDGGRRVHHGVDIFAPRHTPVVAPAPGRVRFVGERGIGGNVVWLYDSKRYLHYYFAHLQTQTVERYDAVEEGDTLGTVGNTGNARTTPPHLHFGIYVQGRGPVDPFHFLAKTDTIPDKISADNKLIGEMVRTTSSTVLRESDGSRNGRILKANTAMKILAASKNMYRVLLPDGFAGYISSTSVELMNEPLQQRSAEKVNIIKDNPLINAVAMKEINSGKNYFILGEFKNHWFVKDSDDETGWLEISEENSTRTSL